MLQSMGLQSVGHDLATEQCNKMYHMKQALFSSTVLTQPSKALIQMSPHPAGFPVPLRLPPHSSSPTLISFYQQGHKVDSVGV